jgi:hypothetical protein
MELWVVGAPVWAGRPHERALSFQREPTDFAMNIEYFERDAPTEDVAVALHRDGAAVVRDQVPGDAVDAVLAELRPYFDKEGRLTESDFNGYRTRGSVGSSRARELLRS